jgi:hypothetical protein
MKLRSTILLLLMVAALAGAIWVLEHQEEGTRQRQLRGGKAVLIRADYVDYLRIEQTNYVMVCRLEREQWRLEEPIISYADNGAVNRILRGLEDLPSWELITEDQRAELHAGLHDYGLALPKARIVFRQDNRDTTLLIGDEAAVGDGLYIMEDDRTDVVVTSLELWDLLPKQPGDVRSRQLFPGAISRLSRLEIQRTSGFLQVSRTDDGGPWMLQQPMVARASGLFVRDLARKFLSVRIEDFIADDVKDFAPYGLDEPAAEITLWPEAAVAPYTIVVGRSADEHPDRVYVRTAHGNSVYAVDKQILVDANLEVEVLRDRDLLHLRPAAVGYIEIRAGETVIELEKDDAGSWSLTKPVRRPADDERVWRTIEAWNRMRVLSFYVNPTGADEAVPEPGARVTIASRRPESKPAKDVDPMREGKELVTLEVYPANWAPGEVLVKLGHEDAVYGIAEQALATTSLNPLEYYDRGILQLAPKDIRRIEIRSDEMIQAVQRDDAGEFVSVSDQGRRLVPGAVENILAEAGNVIVRRFVAEDPADLDLYGLSQPRLSVTFGLTGEAGISKTIHFGREAEPDAVFAMIQGHTTVFELPTSVRDRLSSDLLVRPHIPNKDSNGSGSDPADAT